MLGLKQTQRLSPVLTQQLQQAIKLLQLSQLELMEAIEQEINENPILEVVEEAAPPEQEEAALPEQTEEKDDATEWLERFSPSEEFVSQGERGEYPDYENMVRKTYNLRDYLRWQAGLSDLNPAERMIAEWIIENIDDNGYLAYPLSEISSVSGFTVEELERVLVRIQKLDPPGVGARDCRECILIQYRMEGIENPLFEEFITKYFELIEKGNIKEIAKKTGYLPELIRELLEKVRNFDPKPGRNYGDEQISYIVPDVYIVKKEGEFEVFLNDEDIPELRMNRHYMDLYMNKSTQGDTRRYIKQKVKQAEWFMKSLQQRQKTLYLVSKSIVFFQGEFFEKGIKQLKPLILKDIAQDVGVHESTVSRITTNKYMSTPHGIYEMKFFFPTGIGKDEGNILSTNVVMGLISEIVNNEDKTNPLTDDEIVTILKDKHNIKIARRTIAKYREELHIHSSRERRAQ
ncbi:MAG: RNA polymerase sigma-54 factor [Syntrophus sp. (in: bacteria)]|nr:RNA polymerase sigma-54 factor [Syntrophus sp. (in: bacteria)]